MKYKIFLSENTPINVDIKKVSYEDSDEEKISFDSYCKECNTKLVTVKFCPTETKTIDGQGLKWIQKGSEPTEQGLSDEEHKALAVTGSKSDTITIIKNEGKAVSIELDTENVKLLLRRQTELYEVIARKGYEEVLTCFCNILEKQNKAVKVSYTITRGYERVGFLTSINGNVFISNQYTNANEENKKNLLSQMVAGTLKVSAKDKKKVVMNEEKKEQLQQAICSMF